jgi:hypothetical protein
LNRRAGTGAILSFALFVAPGFAAGTAPVAAASAPTQATVEEVCPDAAPGYARCLALRRTDVAALPATAVSNTSPPPGYGPADLASAYNLPGGSTGTGMTVAVVDAYDLPTAEADLAAYRSTYGLPPCTTANGCFRKVDQSGGTTYPASNSGWGMEIALDIEAVSATCPNCRIILVEANNSMLSNLAQAVDTAVNLGADAVSNSYGGAEFSAETNLDAHFNHPGHAIVASTGDCGWNCYGSFGGTTVAIPQYPAASPYVVAVGGTRLVRDSGTARGWTETAWGNGSTGGGGSGCSPWEPKPAWQHDASCSGRMQADVSAVGDPNTGIAVYVAGSWAGIFGGTSLSAPIIAGVFALAGGPGVSVQAPSRLYANSSALNDVVGGNNDVTWGTCPGGYVCNAVAGYDGPTGLGTPNGTAAFGAVASTFHALTPARILDSRYAVGLSGAFSSHVARTFAVWGQGGVPSGATAVTGNLTVTQQTSGGFLYVGPTAVDSPTSSTLNFPVRDDRANAVTVAVSATGTLSVTYAAPTLGPTAHVIFDVTGYFTADTSGATYHPLDPTRLVDSRTNQGIAGALSSHHAQGFTVTGGVIPAGATAVTGNLTVTQQTSGGFLYVGPTPSDNPTSSTLNFPVRDDRANAVTVALDGAGKLYVTYAAPTLGPTAHVIFDVTGYFTADDTGASYVPVTPIRMLDTRNGTGGLGMFGSHQAQGFTARGGIVPGNATAVTGNLTVTQQTSLGFLFVGPTGMNDPTSSNLNFPTGDDRANAVAVAIGADGKLYVTYAAPTLGPTAQVIFDLTGYFVP